MPFAERYLNALNSSNLQDDEQHKQTEVLAAAALADLSGGSGVVFGSMLSRAKYADPVQHKTFESGNHNLAVLLKVWEQAVIEKGRARKWINIVHTWDFGILEGIAKKIAQHSLAHWLAGECTVCNGTKVVASRACAHCAETPGREPIRTYQTKDGRMSQLEVERIKDMISELEGLCQAHGARAGAKMRQAA
jgi:hypothetical protein